MEIYIGIPQAIIILVFVAFLIAASRETVKSDNDRHRWDVLIGAIAILFSLIALLWFGGFFAIPLYSGPC